MIQTLHRKKEQGAPSFRNCRRNESSGDSCAKRAACLDALQLHQELILDIYFFIN
jgi:hypothetical protein